MTGEFDLIAKHFAPLAGPEGLGLMDDAALLTPRGGEDLILTTDTNVAGVHFLADEAPGTIARRLLRTNLSDLAAKGARPVGYLLALALPPESDEAWLAAFADGLAQDQSTYGIRLFGGDTVGTAGPVVATITAIGATPKGGMLRRAGARDGDALYVTGDIGDAIFGLEVAQGGHVGLAAEHRAHLAGRYRLPEPPVSFGPALAESGLASAAADVSDGLVADAGHIAAASGLAVEIVAGSAPFSPATRAVLDAMPSRLQDAITGGDDYQIVFAGAADNVDALIDLAKQSAVKVTKIGRFVVDRPIGSAAVLGPDGADIPLGRSGYLHR